MLASGARSNEAPAHAAEARRTAADGLPALKGSSLGSTLVAPTRKPPRMSTVSARPQSFGNHRAWPGTGYALAGVVLVIELGRRAWLLKEAPDFWNGFEVLVPIALIVTWWASRRRAQIVQDRVIRLEMRLRLERVLGAARRADIERVGVPWLVALRFASDAELPGLFGDVLAGKFERPDDVKRRIQGWQADWLRV